MTTQSLISQYENFFIDLDGTVYCGSAPIPVAVDTLRSIPSQQRLFVTNNASRSVDIVAQKITQFGLPTQAHQVVTSADAVAALAAEQLAPQSLVYILGSQALSDACRSQGLIPTVNVQDPVAAVMQGLEPSLSWNNFADAAELIHRGARWFSANPDTTLPSERGILPGNGALVALLSTAVNSQPVTAGKPYPYIFNYSYSRLTGSAPLTIGDRLNTDIAASNACSFASLLVLSGVSTADEVLRCCDAQTPTYIARDMSMLVCDSDLSCVGEKTLWKTYREGNMVSVSCAKTQQHEIDSAYSAMLLPHLVALTRTVGEEDRQKMRFVPNDHYAHRAFDYWGLRKHRGDE